MFIEIITFFKIHKTPLKVCAFGLLSNMCRRNESKFYIKTDRIIDVVFLVFLVGRHV